MTHRLPQPPRRRPLFPRITVAHLQITTAVALVVLAGIISGIVITSFPDDKPSPTLAIGTPHRPPPPEDDPSGSPSVEARVLPQPVVMYEPDLEPVPVHTPQSPVVVVTAPPRPAAKVVREVQVPVRVEERRREHKHTHPDRERDKPDTTPPPVPDEDEDSDGRGQVCISQWICVQDKDADENEKGTQR